MTHDRIHSREPSHHVDRWSVGTIAAMDERDGHCVVTVQPGEGEREEDGNGAADAIELVVTFAVRDLFVSRLPIDEDESPLGERVWYRKHGG